MVVLWRMLLEHACRGERNLWTGIVLCRWILKQIGLALDLGQLKMKTCFDSQWKEETARSTKISKKL